VDNALVREFPPRTLDKVERLLDLLAELGEHPMLRGKWALHGGTAINLFMLEVPRLSVDIDLSYVGALDRDAMLAERPAIERSIDEVARSQGYAVSGAPGGHAGRTFILDYRSQWGPDHVKIDCIYLDRSPLMAIERGASTLMPGLRVPLFADAELAGGKVKAFFDRVKVRDLYDIANLKRVLDARSVEEHNVAHKVILSYTSLSATFPHGFESRPERFAGRERELEEQLLPMLRKNEEATVLEQLVGTAREFVSAYVLPQTDAEQEYLGRFSRGAFEPALLFENETTAHAAVASPEAQWKLRNIRKMLGVE
jgi:predicted nucleotidyltransferase component of viral defense system